MKFSVKKVHNVYIRGTYGVKLILIFNYVNISDLIIL
jgi:hypothetical protein